VIDLTTLTEELWDELQETIGLVAKSLTQCERVSRSVRKFLRWEESVRLDGGSSLPRPERLGSNVYKFVDGISGRCVRIRLGSVHSVKGQTHLATMLLSTYWYEHSSKKTMPWLLGERVNGGGLGVRDRRRLRETYVAMTRPSHLLCTAVPRSVMGDDELARRRVASLRTRGWNVAEVCDGSTTWLS